MPFKPGQSGNPSGRPKIANELRAYIAGPNGEKTKADIDAIRSIAEDPKQEGMVRLKARTWLAEQIVGKASQPITGEDGSPIQVMGVDLLPMLERLANSDSSK